jgi:hypothetical protein
MNKSPARSDAKALRCRVLIACGLTTLVVAATPARGQCDFQETAKLTASDAAEDDHFGDLIAVSGDTVVIGVPYDSHPGDPFGGSAYVFVRSGSLWTQQAKLTDSIPQNDWYFGNSVAVSGDTAVVGHDRDSTAYIDAGSAYVFSRFGGVWTQQIKLTASDAAAYRHFGASVAILGDTALVGAYKGFGAAYVFVRSGGVWHQQAKLTASDSTQNDDFGVSVALSGNTAIVGAHLDDHGSGWEDQGSAYVFVRSGSVWTQQAKLSASDATLGDHFGYAVSVSGDTVVVGANEASAAYVFVRSGGMWIQQAKLTASDSAVPEQFGISVAVVGDTALIGKPLDNDGAIDAGAAYIFVRSGSLWTQLAKLTASDPANSDGLGCSVAMSGDTALAGAHGSATNQPGVRDGGSVYAFDLSDYDTDGIPNTSDQCQYTRGGCTVDAQGRPLFDLTDDCIVDGMDIRKIVEEVLLGADWDIADAVDDLLSTCSPCS